jgi:hypothetical protein
VSERSSGVWPEGARHYQFVARGIAEALLAVGAGSSTCAPLGSVAIALGGFVSMARPASCGSPIMVNSSLIWVELFAPVVFARWRPVAWPSEGSLLLDHLPFRVRALDTNGRQIPAGRVAFPS